jgi:molybdopterin converting factor small subunit
MKIMVRYYGFITYETNKHYEEINVDAGITVKGLFDKLTLQYGSRIRELCFPDGEMRQSSITVNRQDLNDKKLFPAGLDSVLQENDIVALIGPLCGAA